MTPDPPIALIPMLIMPLMQFALFQGKRVFQGLYIYQYILIEAIYSAIFLDLKIWPISLKLVTVLHSMFSFKKGTHNLEKGWKPEKKLEQEKPKEMKDFWKKGGTQLMNVNIAIEKNKRWDSERQIYKIQGTGYLSYFQLHFFQVCKTNS